MIKHVSKGPIPNVTSYYVDPNHVLISFRQDTANSDKCNTMAHNTLRMFKYATIVINDKVCANLYF